MSALDRDLRRELEKAVRAARRSAEAGAKSALGALMVGEAADPGVLSESEQDLRRRLRAHGRQLGDTLTGTRQEVDRLTHEVAYEHWHRMLFARFLAENDLLVEPEDGVPVSLSECRELARAADKDPWALAGVYAAAMLPQIFRPDDPSLAVRLPAENQQRLEKILTDLPTAVFTADDAIGWTYQFWQTDRKEEVNRSEVKIGADELPAVTQLFTEPYMVRFLFHNTVGAWRAGRLLAERPELAENAASEDELRRAVRLETAGGYNFDYLRFAREPGDEEGDASGPWRPAAGTFDKWPERTAELRILDPCCGSGHFLVEGLHLLVRLRMEEDELSLDDAIVAVLRDNLHGLEIDPRCAQIAAFSVAFSAWKLAEKVFDLPALQIACSGIAPNATKDEWLALAERTASAPGTNRKNSTYRSQQSTASSAMRHTFESLHGLFAQAPTLGSLINVSSSDRNLLAAKFDEVRPLLNSVLAESEADSERKERTIAAAGIADAARLLSGTYEVVITNVPYLARLKQGTILRQTGESRFPTSKGDLATMFVERGFDWTGQHGTEAFVVPQNWLFLASYERLRRALLPERTWRTLVRLGAKAFQTPMWDFNVMLSILSAETPSTNHRIAGIDVSVSDSGEPMLSAEKATLLTRAARVVLLRQAEQMRNPNCVVTKGTIAHRTLMAAHASALAGGLTGDSKRFWLSFWELRAFGDYWAPLQTTVPSSVPFGGRSGVVQYSGTPGHTRSPFEPLHDCHERGRGVWGKPGIGVSSIGSLAATLYTGERFDPNVAIVRPSTSTLLPALWCFCSSPEYEKSVRQIDQKLNVTNATLVKVPFDLEHWQKIAAERYPIGLPEPYSDDPTQWIFHGHPCGSVVWDSDAKRVTDGPLRTDDRVLQVAVARLLGYHWPAERDPDMRLAVEQRVWVERCAELDQFADPDGIVCLPAVRGEEPAADRLRRLIGAAYRGEWPEQRLLRAANRDERPAKHLDDWLRRYFFDQHCRLFHHRPFIWHIWDGLSDGFHALVNYHRLAGPDGEGRRTLEALTFSYLGDWIESQRAAKNDGDPGAEARLVAALELQKQLAHILHGEPPLDLFIRWKSLHRQPLGWEPDIDDGVRLNIRPFLRAELRKGGRKSAGLLRARPNIHWRRDRGGEPQKFRAKRKGVLPEEIRPKRDFPWFWDCPGSGTKDERTDFMGGEEFDGNRWNDLHYTLAAKRAARERHEREVETKVEPEAEATEKARRNAS